MNVMNTLSLIFSSMAILISVLTMLVTLRGRRIRRRIAAIQNQTKNDKIEFLGHGDTNLYRKDEHTLVSDKPIRFGGS